MGFEIPLYGKGIGSNRLGIFGIFGVVTRQLVMSVGSKHVCAWFEFKLANGLFEDCGSRFCLGFLIWMKVHKRRGMMKISGISLKWTCRLLCFLRRYRLFSSGRDVGNVISDTAEA